MPDERDTRMVAAAAKMRADHGPDHARHEMWSELATLLDRLAELAPYWAEPYAAPFVPIIEAGVHVATAYETAEAPELLDEVYVVFDAPPGPEAGRFVETEDEDGRGVGFDPKPAWAERDDGYWTLGPFLVPAEAVRRG